MESICLYDYSFLQLRWNFVTFICCFSLIYVAVCTSLYQNLYSTDKWFLYFHLFLQVFGIWFIYNISYGSVFTEEIFLC